MGFTTVNPTVESNIPWHAGVYYSSSEHWMLNGSKVFHNEQKKSISSNIHSLKPGESAAIAVDDKGDLHFFYKSKHVSVIWEGLPMKPYWGFVDVFGKVSSVKVEILQSEYCTAGTIQRW